MIKKSEVFKLALSLGLRPETIEKDYVLGWMLFGVHSNRRLRKKWIFKGGTSLKKCFFETFRFSEDLDFTLSDPSHFNQQFLLEEFHKTADLLYEEAGIEFAKDKFTFKIIDKPGGKTAQGRIHFNGPLRRRKEKYASIKLDLTNDEMLVLEPRAKKIYHPYSDKPKAGMEAVCYAFEEVIAEKTRALAQRAMPRDLYDVIHFFRNRSLIPAPRLVYDVLRKKCDYKKMDMPDFDSIKNHSKTGELKSEWKNMLEHQLPFLPPLENYWRDLPLFFDWLSGKPEKKPLQKITEDHELWKFNRIKDIYSANFVIEKIKFSAINRLSVKLNCQGKQSIVEPYSFRKDTEGCPWLYGCCQSNGKTVFFRINDILSADWTSAPFSPRYAVEIP